MKRGARFKDKTGQTIGELVVIKLTCVNEKKQAIWECQCSCGSIILRSTNQLQKIKSCGHLKGTNVRNGRLYNRWYNIRERTRNPDNIGYSNYGGRGINMCDRWYNSFDAFVEDMGIPPEGFSLERIDNDKGYYKENCKWANSFEQASNKRGLVLVNFKENTLPLKAACREAGLDYKLVHQRMKRKNLNPQDNFEWYLSRYCEKLQISEGVEAQ